MASILPTPTARHGEPAGPATPSAGMTATTADHDARPLKPPTMPKGARMFATLETVLSRRMADRIEQTIAVGLYVWLCVRLMPSEFPPAHWFPVMLVVSEGTVILFLLARRRTEKISLSTRDWGIAFAGTLSPLLVVNPEKVFLPELGLIVLLIGFFFHFGAKLGLRRSFGIVPADRGIKSRGLYAIVRHPMYLGYLISHIGFLIAAPSLWNAAAYSICWSFLFGRIFLEERFLSASPEYRAYRSKVRYRLIPGVL